MNKFIRVSLTAVRNIDVVVRHMLAPLRPLSRPQLRPLQFHCISKHRYLFRNALQTPTHIFSTFHMTMIYCVYNIKLPIPNVFPSMRENVAGLDNNLRLLKRYKHCGSHDSDAA